MTPTRRFLAVLLLAALGAQAAVIEVPFQRNATRDAILLEARVNGKNVVLLLDTGASITVLDKSVAGLTAFDLKQSRFKQTGPGLRGEAVWARVGLRLGPKVWRDRAVVVMDLSEVSRVYGRRIDGILGQDVLTEFDQVTIDFKAKIIRFGRPSD
ncbi:MAG TPA: retropepsin-like aspartic protease [Anaerolineales bacterium]